MAETKKTSTKATTKKTVAAKKPAAKKAAPKTTAPKEVKATKTTKKTAKREAKATKVEFAAKNLPAELFASEKIHAQAIFDVVIAERASRRQGTHDVKNRSEVSGGGKKPWRQKGTGRARAGSTRSPIWVGGGRAFGPTPERNYNLKINRKVRRAAFISALTQLANHKAVLVDDFKLSKISTKDAVAKLSELKINDLKRILIVTEDETVFKSVQNLKNVICTKPRSILVEQLVLAEVLVISSHALAVLEGKDK